jgi:ribonuclease P protein component
MINGAVTGDRKAGPPGKAAFTSKHKLTKATEFERVFNKPFVSSDACFKVLARSNEGAISRLGMAVSRQIDKRAVGRNRLKRIVRESFRLRFARSGTCLDIVILPRRDTATMCNEKLFDSLNRHWSRLENQFEG